MVVCTALVLVVAAAAVAVGLRTSVTITMPHRPGPTASQPIAAAPPVSTTDGAAPPAPPRVFHLNPVGTDQEAQDEVLLNFDELVTNAAGQRRIDHILIIWSDHDGDRAATSVELFKQRLINRWAGARNVPVGTDIRDQSRRFGPYIQIDLYLAAG